MEIRKITLNDKEQLEHLISVVEENLEDEKWWLPINMTSRIHFFDDEWTEFYGMFDGEKLIGAGALFFNEHEFGESVRYLGRDISCVAEIGRAMVHPNYRGNGYLYQIALKLLEVAKEKGIHHILATVHPDNQPSQRSFKKLGMKKQCTCIKDEKYERDIFLLDI